MQNCIFFYGTLMPGIANPLSDLIHKNTSRVGNGSYQGKLFLVGDYPGVVPDKSPKSRVFGVIHKLMHDPELLSVIDDYEGYDFENEENSLFIRKSVVIDMENGERRNCWIYLYNKDVSGLTHLPHGNYLRYRKELNNLK